MGWWAKLFEVPEGEEKVEDPLKASDSHWMEDHLKSRQKIMEMEIQHMQWMAEHERKERESRVMDVERQGYYLILDKHLETVQIVPKDKNLEIPFEAIALIIEDLTQAQKHMSLRAMKNILILK